MASHSASLWNRGLANSKSQGGAKTSGIVSRFCHRPIITNACPSERSQTSLQTKACSHSPWSLRNVKLIDWLIDSPTDFLTCDTISSSPKNNGAFQGWQALSKLGKISALMVVSVKHSIWHTNLHWHYGICPGSRGWLGTLPSWARSLPGSRIRQWVFHCFYC